MHSIKKFINNKKGFTQVLIAIVGVVVVVLVLMVGAIILSKMDSGISRTGLSTAANDTLDAASTAGYGALNLLNLAPYILGAVAIIAAILGIFAYIKLRQ